QEPLGTSLKKFWTEYGTPTHLFVSSRYLEKILDAKLGGTVAQIVTSGFETWPILRQPTFPDRFDIKPYRQEPLASQELIFGLSERVNQQGEILKPLQFEELEFINSKLKLMNVKRVCVNLLFANRNPNHQKQVAHYFAEQGFEVFASERSPLSADEMPAWRKNVINACLSGAFSEHVEDIQKSFAENTVKLSFLDHHGNVFLENKNQIAGSLFAWANALSDGLKGKAEQILCLDLESWALISCREKSAFWESSWGLIENTIPVFKKLRMQPTLEITQGFLGGLQFSKNELGFEPGPMCFGRAWKPTIFDMLHQKFPSQIPQVQDSGCRKFKDHLVATIKNIPELETATVDRLIQNLLDHLIHHICIEAQFKSEKSAKKTLVTGFFAPALFPLLQKQWFDSKLELDPLASLRSIHSLSALAGEKQ
ncbi:MAG: hydantoinase/oxoprolinase N-terminal domain-containing protein, partial [Pseudobdellovibrionaceae bacterium]